MVGPAAALLLTVVAPAQQAALVPPVAPLHEAAQQSINQPWLTDDERKELRIFHGVWDERDLDTPSRRAAAAIALWRSADPVFADPATPPRMRAEMLLLDGRAEEALRLLEGANDLASRRLTAEALLVLGRVKEAADEARVAIGDADPSALESAADVVNHVRCVMVIQAAEGGGGDDHQGLINALSRAHQELDRLYWPAHLCEAKLLDEKSNRPAAVAALHETLALNPRCAEAWAMLGGIAVDSFDFDGAASAARALRRLNPEHPYAAMLLTDSALTQNDPDAAEDHLRPLLETRPHLRRALALRAAIDAVRYDRDATDRSLARFDELSPGSPDAHFLVGKYVSFQRQYDWAAEILNEAIRRRPHWPAPLIELGLLQMQAANDDAARDALDRALELDRFNVRAVNSKFLLEELDAFATIESEHFLIRYRPGIDEAAARLMPDVLDAMHKRVAARFQHEPARKTVIELMPDHAFFSVRITGMPWVHTVAACTGPLIAIEVPREGPPQKHLGLFDWFEVLTHEYTHTITLSQTRNRIPHWLTEAAAVSMENAPRKFSTCLLLARELETGGLFTLDTINWGFIRPRRPQDRGLAYAQGHWMVEYMNERFGESSLVRLLQRYHEGAREREAMPDTLGISREDFYAGFLDWAREQVRAWGLAATPTMLELTDSLREQSPDLFALMAAARDARAGMLAEALTGEIGRPRVDDEKPLTGDDWPPLKRPPLHIPDETLDEWRARYPEHPDLLELKIRRAITDPTRPDPSLVNLLEELARLRPVDPWPHRVLTQIHLASETPARAIPHLKIVDATEDKNDAYTLELARLLREQGESREALAAAIKSVRINPYSAANRELAAAIAIEAKELNEAKRHIVALTILEPDRAQHRKRLEAIDRALNP